MGAGVPICILVMLASAGCHQTPAVSHQRLIEHQAMIDFSGLKPVESIPGVQAAASPPRQWEQRPFQTGPFFSHQQWRSPSTKTGVGVAHVKLPLPVSIGLLKWIAKREYTKKSNDGRIIAEWTDELGRPWFEAENDKYHVRGYIVAKGFEAWVVYFGYKSKLPPEPAEIALASRSADTIVPELP